MKRLLAVFLIIMTFTALVPIMGVTAKTVFPDPQKKSELISVLEKHAPLNDYIDVSEFEIPYNNESRAAFMQMCLDEAPLLFHISGFSFLPDRSGKIIKEVYFKSIYDDNDTYLSRYNACIDRGEQLLSGIKGNNSLDNVTKALVLHDRLLEICRYDIDGVNSNTLLPDADTICGPFIDGKSTCKGYTSAYIYLLREIGIPARLCRSKQMDHIWVIVQIDGKEYHVDLTFDDALPDVTGRISHEYFMVSSQKLANTLHGDYTDWDRSPSSVLYDNGYWRNSKSVFQVIGDDVYYIDHTINNEALCRVGDTEPVVQLDEAWAKGPSLKWTQDYYCLSSDGTDLLYSCPKDIKAYNIISGKSYTIYTPDIEEEFRNIFGFRYDDGYLIYSTNVDENFNPDSVIKNNSDVPYQKRVKYEPIFPKEDIIPPTLRIKSANGLTVKLEASDDTNIAGIYYGTDAVYTNNHFLATSENEITLILSDTGDYSFVAVDTSFNPSEPVYKSFYSIRFDGNMVSVPGLFAAQGESFTLPELICEGYRFMGWTLDKGDGKVIKGEMIAESSVTLYAVWESGYISNFTDVRQNHWFAGAVEYAVKRGYMKGMSETRFSPGSNITREQFVLILANVAGTDVTPYMYVPSGFEDVKTGKWYSGAVTWATRQGYVSGISATKFGTGQYIQRGALARLLLLFMESQGVDTDGRAELSVFSDAGLVEGSWMEDGIEWAVHCGIMSGIKKGDKLYVDPKGTATRAQTAVMLMKADKLY